MSACLSLSGIAVKVSVFIWTNFGLFPPPLFSQQEDEKFLTEVFAQLTDEATDDSKRRELVRAAVLLFYHFRNNRNLRLFIFFNFHLSTF